MSERPLIFISCGQVTQDEIDLGKSIESYIRDETDFKPYYAERENTLDALVVNVLSSLDRCAGLIGVMHKRGTVHTRNRTFSRGSVWVEQEIAIAAFVQHVLKRPLQVALFVQEGIHREGLREQLRIDPIEFKGSDEVLHELRKRVNTWLLLPRRELSLTARWRRIDRKITGERHDYTLYVELFNDGSRRISDWKIDVWVPQAFLEPSNDSEILKHYSDNDTNYSEQSRTLYPGEVLPVFNVNYFVDRKNWPKSPFLTPDQRDVWKIRIKVCTGDMDPWEHEIPMADVQSF